MAPGCSGAGSAMCSRAHGRVHAADCRPESGAIRTRLQPKGVSVAIGRSAQQAWHARGTTATRLDGRAPEAARASRTQAASTPTPNAASHRCENQRSGSVGWARACGPPAEREARRDACSDDAGRGRHMPTAQAASIIVGEGHDAPAALGSDQKNVRRCRAKTKSGADRAARIVGPHRAELKGRTVRR